jgi:hypothetical protein
LISQLGTQSPGCIGNSDIDPFNYPDVQGFQGSIALPTDSNRLITPG